MRHWTEKLFITHADIYGKDLEWMIQGAEKGAPLIKEILTEHGVPSGLVLDVPCGIGRYSFELAKLGYRVDGLDISPHFIERAKEFASERGVADQCSFRVGDMRKLDTSIDSERYDAVLNLFTSIGYWDDKTDQSILEQFHKVAKKGGLMFLETGNRDRILRNFRTSDVYERLDGMRLTEIRSMDMNTSRMNSTFSYYVKQGEDLMHKASVDLDHRLYSLHELRNIVKKAGWEIEEVYGDFHQSPFKMDSPSIVIVARKN